MLSMQAGDTGVESPEDTDAKSDDESGTGRVHPAARARWNRLPNVTSVALPAWNEKWLEDMIL